MSADTRPIRALGRAFGSRRGRALLAAGVVGVVAVSLAATNPFASPNHSTSDNGSSTSLATVTRQTLTSVTSVDGTLEYEGNATFSLPAGTAPSAVAQAGATLQDAMRQVHNDESALSQAKALAAANNGATELEASSQLTSAKTTVADARHQLAADEALGCPPATSGTVGSAASSGGGSAAGAAVHANLEDAPTTPATTTTAAATAPAVTDVTDSDATTTNVTLSGSVTPNGLSTTYVFEYGTTTAYGSTTAPSNAGSGTDPVPVTATLAGLSPNTTYLYALAATNTDGTTTGTPETFTTATSSCTEESATITADAQAVTEDADTLRADKLSATSTVTSASQQVAADEATERQDAQALATAQAAAVNPATTITALPSVGATVSRGQAICFLDGVGVPLFYGSVTPWRALSEGVSGADVAELQQNLVALGFGAGLVANGDFRASTMSAVKAWQRSLGADSTGTVDLGAFLVAPAAIRVTKLVAAVGATAGAAATSLLDATSTTHVIDIALSTANESEIATGEQVAVTLPDERTTSGVVRSVGSVATAGSNGGSPTVPITIALTDPSAAGDLDQAPVSVGITTNRVTDALVVPVDALLALSGGGYALEVAGTGGTHRLEAVHVGRFDDAAGVVQVSGPSVAAGQRVVVPTQ